MWNSNSVISWLIVRSGLAIESIRPPAGGRAPGWHAGVVVARRAAASELGRRSREQVGGPAATCPPR